MGNSISCRRASRESCRPTARRSWPRDSRSAAAPCAMTALINNGTVRILVVEDDRKTASFIAKALKAEGFAVDTLREGDDALAAIELTHFDAVVLDIMIVGRDGLSVLKQMRA